MGFIFWSLSAHSQPQSLPVGFHFCFFDKHVADGYYFGCFFKRASPYGMVCCISLGNRIDQGVVRPGIFRESIRTPLMHVSRHVVKSQTVGFQLGEEVVLSPLMKKPCSTAIILKFIPFTVNS